MTKLRQAKEPVLLEYKELLVSSWPQLEKWLAEQNADRSAVLEIPDAVVERLLEGLLNLEPFSTLSFNLDVVQKEVLDGVKAIKGVIAQRNIAIEEVARLQWEEYMVQVRKGGQHNPKECPRGKGVEACESCNPRVVPWKEVPDDEKTVKRTMIMRTLEKSLGGSFLSRLGKKG